MDSSTLSGSNSMSNTTVFAAAVTAIATIIANGSTNATRPHQPPADDGGKCHLLGPFAILVQGALGALALLTLVFKRWRERPQRPVKIWAFDVSKQVFGTLLLHMANLFMSMFSAGEISAELAKAATKSVGAAVDDDWRPNPCSFYLLNLGIDTTIGIVVLLLILKVLHAAASLTPLANPPESIKSGNYGEPPRVSWWLKQTMLYFIGLLGMKMCVFVIFQLCPWIVVVGDWALRWTEGNTALQVAFVMLIFPLIMNGFQYYVVDSFIKKGTNGDDAASQISTPGSEGERGGLLAGDEHGDSIDDDTPFQKIIRTSSSEFPNRGRPSRGSTRRHDDDTGEVSSSSSTVVAERDGNDQLRGVKDADHQPYGTPVTGT